MFKVTFRDIRRVFPAALVLGLVVLLQGCGDSGRSPLDSQVDELSQVEAPRVVDTRPSYITFSPFRATKPTDAEAEGVISKFVEETIDAKKGGRLDITFSEKSKKSKKSEKSKKSKKDDDDDDVTRVKKATFKVRPGSMKADTEISMTVYSGSTLADVKVEFTPPGHSFDPAAGLALLLEGNLKPGKMTGYHIAADGTVTLVEVEVKKDKGGGWKLKMDIPGFSEYTYEEEGGDD